MQRGFNSMSYLKLVVVVFQDDQHENVLTNYGAKSMVIWTHGSASCSSINSYFGSEY